jgi:Ca2+-binding RTX toxin-like protein
MHTTALDQGDKDVITLLGGNNTVLAGQGNDTVTTGAGNDDIIGDNGEIIYTAGIAIMLATSDTDVTTTGNDTIIAGDGDNRILAGLGQDNVTTGADNDTVLGDNGELQLVNNILIVAVSNDPDLGDDDIIELGDGDNLAIAGTGADTVSGGLGRDQVFADNGIARFSSEGLVTLLATSFPFGGGNDNVNLRGGDNVVMAGTGDDVVNTGAGQDDVIGDHGIIEYVDGVVVTGSSTDEDNSFAGNDEINTGDGDDRVIAGLGNDTVNAAGGNDKVIADSGSFTYKNGNFSVIITGLPLLGGDDVLALGDGDDWALGGGGRDTILGEGGNDFIFGDYGIFGFDDKGQFYADSIFPLFGDDDSLDGGDGSDWLIGGHGRDLFFALFTEDTIVGNYGRATIVNTSNSVSVSSDPANRELINAKQSTLYNIPLVIQDEIETLQTQSKRFDQAVQTSSSTLTLLEDPILASYNSFIVSSLTSLPSTDSNNNDVGGTSSGTDGKEANDATEEDQPEDATEVDQPEDECLAENTSDVESVCEPKEDETTAESAELTAHLQDLDLEGANEVAESLAALSFMAGLKRHTRFEKMIKTIISRAA